MSDIFLSLAVVVSRRQMCRVQFSLSIVNSNDSGLASITCSNLEMNNQLCNWIWYSLVLSLNTKLLFCTIAGGGKNRYPSNCCTVNSYPSLFP